MEGAELTRGESRLTKSIIGELLEKLVGSSMWITVDGDGRVVGLDGARRGRIRAAAGNDPLGNRSLWMASVIDPDGWKKSPSSRSSARRRARRARNGTLPWCSWGPLGSWSGRAAYAHRGREGGLDRIDYALELKYQRPKAAAAGLPFDILLRRFPPPEGRRNDRVRRRQGRVVRAEERFPVKGSLTIGLLGQETPLELDESQHFLVRILDEKPNSNR